MSKFLVCIDPGHGGHDPGAVGNGLQEKDIVLRIALCCAQLLNGHPEINAVLTRDRDVFIPIGSRVRMANDLRADAFVSIHVNGWDTPRPHGFEIFRHILKNNKSLSLKQALYSKLSPIWIAESSLDRGKKQANYQVIRMTNCPSVLIEHGFVSNPHDASLLKRGDFLKAQAQAIVDGLVQFISDTVEDTPPVIASNQVAYRVRVDGEQIGAYRNAENIAALAKNHIQRGAQQIVIERV